MTGSVRPQDFFKKVDHSKKQSEHVTLKEEHLSTSPAVIDISTWQVNQVNGLRIHVPGK